jgi:hypothetical protein
MAEATFFAESEVQVTSSEVCILGRSFAVREIEDVKLVRSSRMWMGSALLVLGVVCIPLFPLVLFTPMFRLHLFPYLWPETYLTLDQLVVITICEIILVTTLLVTGSRLMNGPALIRLFGRFGTVDLECGDLRYAVRLAKAIKTAVRAYDTRLEHRSVVV